MGGTAGEGLPATPTPQGGGRSSHACHHLFDTNDPPCGPGTTHEANHTETERLVTLYTSSFHTCVAHVWRPGQGGGF